MEIRRTSAIAIILLVVLIAVRAFAADPPVWWPDAVREAGENGYRLTTPEELDRLMSSGEPILLLDVRPEYEYAAGHLPGAVIMEFDLGDRFQCREEKKQQLVKLLGPDRDRTVVIYCRSFR